MFGWCWHLFTYAINYHCATNRRACCRPATYIARSYRPDCEQVSAVATLEPCALLSIFYSNDTKIKKCCGTPRRQRKDAVGFNYVKDYGRHTGPSSVKVQCVQSLPCLSFTVDGHLHMDWSLLATPARQSKALRQTPPAKKCQKKTITTSVKIVPHVN